jgi:hypothetical protein
MDHHICNHFLEISGVSSDIKESENTVKEGILQFVPALEQGPEYKKFG